VTSSSLIVSGFRRIGLAHHRPLASTKIVPAGLDFAPVLVRGNVIAAFDPGGHAVAGSLAKFAAMRRASSRVSRLVAERRCGSSSK
jgi:hypothetical protein